MVWVRLFLVLTALGLIVPIVRADEPGGKKDELKAYDARIKPKDREHWSFKPVHAPDTPSVKDVRWVRNPIDRFILSKLEAKGWKTADPAEPRALLRRVYLDLIGLPPTPEDQEGFGKSGNPELFERVIDDLLARPAYGERWGRHWLDLVRYAESNGYERDGHKPQIWRYRDYVIRAFNEDKPYDRFILEQLAGDELPDANIETMLATGYYRLGPWDDEPADPKEDRFDQIDDMIHTTSQVFLGLTLSCARCHNHKFEPLTMHDYYRMAAIFDTLQRPQDGRRELDRPAGSREQIRAIAERDRQILRVNLSAQRVPFFPGNAVDCGVRGAVADLYVRALREATPDLPRGYFMEERSPKPPATHLHIRGKASRPGPETVPGMPAVLVDRQPNFLPADESTSRRRLTLACWIASADNPLTARVIVNRVWQFHFGEGLVRSPSDFGVKGDEPTHPELLDWLANWFVKNGWSMKKLHRLILTSNTYRMNKRWNKEYGVIDPEDKLLWRFPYRRLEVEPIRDSVLAVSGQLNSKMYGPSMFPPVPKEALEGSSDPDKIWIASDEKEASRRTIYACVKRSMVVPLLEVLDFCDTTRSAAKRNVTSVGPQALSLFNGEFVNRQAEHLARRLEKEVGDDPQKQIARAYSLALCRPPSEKEQTAMAAFLHKEVEKLKKESSEQGKLLAEDVARHRALVQACRVIFNLNEFVYPD